MGWKTFIVALGCMVWMAGGGTFCRQAGAAEPVRHPNLLLNAEELGQIKQKIQEHAWARRLFERVKARADESGIGEHNLREAALVYALTGQERYGQAVRNHLVFAARYWRRQLEQVDLKTQPEFAAWGHWTPSAWAYDLTYALYLPEEREAIERWLRSVGKTIIEGEKLWTTTPNLVFDKHWRVGLIGYVLGDKALIDWALRDPGVHGPHRGGFYAVLDSMVQDGHFWGEAPIYALHYDVHGMLALAEAARHYDGTDLYGYVSKKSGASIKSILDGYLRMAYPLEKTGIGGGSIRLATFGDGSTSYLPSGILADTFLVNAPEGGGWLLGELELAWKRYRDPGYAWLLGLRPERDGDIRYGRAVWGLVALTHGEPLPKDATPPLAPSGLYRSQGFAMLRSDESPGYWTGGGLAAVVRLGNPVGHGHEDYFSLVLHGKGRLLYPDLNVIQYEPTGINWTHEGIAHNTLLVDHQSPRPGPFATREEFTPDAKFLAVSGSAFAGTRQQRAVLLAREYLVDVFRAEDTQVNPRTFDWVMHGLGRLYPGNPQAYRPTHGLMPYYGWVDNEQGRVTGAAWQADWVQQTAGITPGAQFGPPWFAQRVGVRLRMLGHEGTEVYCGDGPLTDGPPYHRIDGNPEGSSPLVVARRRGPAATFAAVHEPYTTAPAILRVESIGPAETPHAFGVRVEAAEFSDRILVAFFDGQKVQELSAPGGEVFRFADYAYLRATQERLVGRGRLVGFRLAWPHAKTPALVLNGQPAAVQREGRFVRFGEVPAAAEAIKPAPIEPKPAPAGPSPEERAWVHVHFRPEELHLPAGGSQEAEVVLRCVGRGQAQGTIRLVAPAAISVQPQQIAVAPMAEGDERRLRLSVKAAAGTPSGLYAVRLEAGPDQLIAGASLPVAVGVVLAEDKRLPGRGQYVIRAPGYTMKVDQSSGVSYYLLDSRGRRRHGRMHNTNFIQGFPGVMRDGKWCFHYRHPCRFVWEGENTLTVGCEGTYGDHDVRLQYTFGPEAIHIGLVPPTRPDAEHTMWLGNFDALGPAVHDGTQDAPHEPILARRFFFPHPWFDEGVLLEFAAATPLRQHGTAVSFPMRVGQRVTLRFATPQEAERLMPKPAK